MSSPRKLIGVGSDSQTPLLKNRCGSCQNFEPPKPNSDTGLCVANYPVVIPTPGQYPGQIGAASLFPPMRPEERCGKYVENFKLTQPLESEPP